ncbi:hypothetical protein IV203_023790 [Nitzschia inconspicua]|uniref:Uncharacterized protein n=1 Tax=Nitzschia inconspicua TaxID=303405 RepID=A0A9K3KAQ1_9STRA|nr:hypothetical protein IV203_023790 [Nitzschia inconspicua]
MAWLIGSGKYGVNDGVPQDIVDDLIAMNLTKAPEISPHIREDRLHIPSWPAMHSSGSSCSFWLPAVANMTLEQYCEALRVDFAVAFAIPLLVSIIPWTTTPVLILARRLGLKNSRDIWPNTMAITRRRYA